MAYSMERVFTKRKAVNFLLVHQREACHTCCFVELKSASLLRGKSYYCQMLSLPTPAYGICDKHVRKEKP